MRFAMPLHHIGVRLTKDYVNDHDYERLSGRFRMSKKRRGRVPCHSVAKGKKTGSYISVEKSR